MSTLWVLVILNWFKIAHIQAINQYSGIWNIQLLIRLLSIRLAILLKNDLINTLKLFQN